MSVRAIIVCGTAVLLASACASQGTQPSASATHRETGGRAPAPPTRPVSPGVLKSSLAHAMAADCPDPVSLDGAAEKPISSLKSRVQSLVRAAQETPKDRQSFSGIYSVAALDTAGLDLFAGELGAAGSDPQGVLILVASHSTFADPTSGGPNAAASSASPSPPSALHWHLTVLDPTTGRWLAFRQFGQVKGAGC